MMGVNTNVKPLTSHHKRAREDMRADVYSSNFSFSESCEILTCISSDGCWRVVFPSIMIVR